MKIHPKIFLAVGVTAAFFLLLEAALRLTRFQYAPREKTAFHPTIAGYDGTFEYRLQTFFDPPGYLWRTESAPPFTDEHGFRLPSCPLQKEPGKFRIVFLGGSTTQGQRHAYPERAVQILNAALGENRYEALNIACAAYTTHQSLLALQRWAMERQPDLVCVYHGWNDLAFADDGYSDSEKDAPHPAAPRINPWRRRWIARLRILQAIARVADACDRSWPRLRVPFPRFEANLRAIARLCASRDIPLLLFTRPPFNQEAIPSLDGLALNFLDIFNTTNHALAQNNIHEACVAIQQRVAATEPNVRLFDASAIMLRLQQQARDGSFGAGISLYQPDAAHLRPIGEQLLAEQLALALAPPEHRTLIARYLESPEYQVATARQLLQELMPREAAYFARKALNLHPEAERLLAEAAAQTEFADLFWQACWGGSDPVYESKLAKLTRCLALRPSDFGVMMQMAFVCFNMDHPGDAARVMAPFKPSNPTEHYRWAWYMFSSHVAAGRRPQAEHFARLLLQLDPSDPDARAFLQQ